MTTTISDVGIKPIKVRSQPPEKRSSPTSRRLSKQGSTTNVNSANEVYYGDSSVSVPFRWESRPGTPKVNFGERRPLPPLTPPPSYLSSPARKSVKKHHSEAADIHSSGGILHNVLPRLNLIKKSHLHSSPSLSSSSSSSVSSSPWSSSSRSARSSPFTPDSEGRQPRRKLAHHLRRKDEDEDEEDGEYEEAHLESLCFGISGRGNSSNRGCTANFIKLLLRQHA